MDEKIREDYKDDSEARRRITLIMEYFEDPIASYETIKKIYTLSPDFIRFCYKALGIRAGFKIKTHTYGFKGTPHTPWDDFSTRLDDHQFLRDMMFETAFRMLQQVFNSYPLIDTYEYIKHANTALARCRVCELIWYTNVAVMKNLQQAKTFFIWFITRYNGVELHYELYDYSNDKENIYTTMYYYNTIYALKYDFVKKKDLTKSLEKFKRYSNISNVIDTMTIDKLEYDVYTKIYYMD